MYSFCDFVIACQPKEMFTSQANLVNGNNMQTCPNFDKFIEKARDRKLMNASLNRILKSQLSRISEIDYIADSVNINDFANRFIDESDSSEEYFMIHIPNVNIEQRSHIDLPDGSFIPRAITPHLQLDFEHAVVDNDNNDITFHAFYILPNRND